MQAKKMFSRAISLSFIIIIAFADGSFSFGYRQLQRQLALVPKVTLASPNLAKLAVGGSDVSIALKGYYLNLITGATILQGDRVVPATEIVITLAGTPTASAATIVLKATAQAIAGTDYRLRANYGTRAVDISISILSIEIYKLTAMPLPAPKPPTTQEPQPGIVMVNSTTISSRRFSEIITQIFNNAYFLANSGWNQNQITSFSVPNLCYFDEPFAERLDYPFNAIEIASCLCINPKKMGSKFSRKAIRGYLDNQKTGPWVGSIAQGKLKIMFPFNDKHFIKTRALDKQYENIGEYSSWDELISDRNIADYCCAGLGLDIFLIPLVTSGNISYSDVTTTWANLSYYDFCYSLESDIGFNWAWGYWCLGDTEQNLIIAYRDKINEILRSRVKNFFLRDDVRNYITQELNKEIKSGNFAGLNIVSITGMGSDLTITFDKHVPKY